MQLALAALERYINDSDGSDVLIRAGLIHYQFETIHPFLDGNGRVGRLLITLFLLENNILTTPALNISCFLKQNQWEYYERMSAVRRQGNYEQWIQFFLQAIVASAQDALATIDLLSKLHEEHETVLSKQGRARQTMLSLFHYLEANPIIDIMQTAQALQLSYNTVATAVRRLVELGILPQRKAGKRNRCFGYEAYLAILRQGT